MSFLWIWVLLFLILIPLLIMIYILILRRKRKFAVQYSSLTLIRAAIPKNSRWRQHLPFILFLISLISIVTAAARPVAEIEVPLSRTTIILALDISRSMCATDVSPNRLTVAQEAASAFIEDQADETRIGIVAFAGFAEIVVPPTNNKVVLKEAINNFTTSIGTAVGSATLKSIDAISEVNDAVEPSAVNIHSVKEGPPLEDVIYQPDIIVVLTDGANSRGPLPLDAAQQAADRQIRVYTIGFGSKNPEQMVCSPRQLGSDAFSGRFGGDSDGRWGGGSGGSGFGGFRRYLLLDEPTLKGMAELTGGEYYRAENAEQLFDVFIDLPTEIILQKQRLEISVLFTFLGAILISIAVLLSLRWHHTP